MQSKNEGSHEGTHSNSTFLDTSNTAIVFNVSGTHAAQMFADASTTPAAFNLNGTYSLAAISTLGATTPTAMLINDGQNICFNNTNGCLKHVSGGLHYIVGGTTEFSVDDTGNEIVAGTLGVTGAATFSGGLTGTLTGGASLDLPRAGGTMTGTLTVPGITNTGNETVAGTLGVTGQLSTTGILTVNGAANNVVVGGSATGAAPGLMVSGSDTNINLSLSTKGSGSLQTNNGVVIFAYNNLSLNGATTGNAPVVQAWGSDTNVNLKLIAKGTGAIMATSSLNPQAGLNVSGGAVTLTSLPTTCSGKPSGTVAAIGWVSGTTAGTLTLCP